MPEILEIRDGFTIGSGCRFTRTAELKEIRAQREELQKYLKDQVRILSESGVRDLVGLTVLDKYSLLTHSDPDGTRLLIQALIDTPNLQQGPMFLNRESSADPMLENVSVIIRILRNPDSGKFSLGIVYVIDGELSQKITAEILAERCIGVVRNLIRWMSHQTTFSLIKLAAGDTLLRIQNPNNPEELAVVPGYELDSAAAMQAYLHVMRHHILALFGIRIPHSFQGVDGDSDDTSILIRKNMTYSPSFIGSGDLMEQILKRHFQGWRWYSYTKEGAANEEEK